MTENESQPRSLEAQKLISTPLDSSNNPIAETLEDSPISIDDLFNMDAEQITDEQIALTCKYLRERRAQWERDEAEVQGGKKRATKPSSGASQKAVGKKALDDLDLDDL